MSRLPGISDLFRSRSQARRRNPKRRREAERFAGRMESLESRAMLAFSTLPAAGDMGGLPIILSSTASGPNELTIVLDDITKLDIGEIAATITTSDGQTGQYWNFSDITYAASNDTDGSVVNTVKLWTSYEADVLGYETAPAADSEFGLATSWFVASRFPAGGAPVVLSMLNADSLTVTSGVIGGGASTIAGEFESPTLAPALNATTGANITLISGTSVTGTDLGGTADLEPIVAYTLTLQSQTAGVQLDTDVFTVDDLTINAAGTITLNGLLQSTSGDIEVESTSGQILLGGAELHALDGGITLRTLKEGIVQVPATAANPRWQDYIVAETGVTIEAGGEVVLIGTVRSVTGDVSLTSATGTVSTPQVLSAAVDVTVMSTGSVDVTGLIQASTGDIKIKTVSGALAVTNAGKVHAVEGGIDFQATRGVAILQDLFANNELSVRSLGDVTLNGAIQSTTADIVIASDGSINNGARVLAGGTIDFAAELAVTSLGGGIVRLELLSGGVNYDYAIVTIAAPAAGGGRQALARATVVDGSVAGLTIVDPGYGYAPNELVAVSIEGNPEVRDNAGNILQPAASGARAAAFSGTALSSLIAGDSVAITAGTQIDITNEVRASRGDVSLNVLAGTLDVAEVFAGDDIGLSATQTITIAGLVRSDAGDITVDSKGGGIDMRGTVLAPGGGANVYAAGQIVQRGGSVSRDKVFLLSGGRDYTYALVVVDPPPGAGETALARAVITYYDPLDLTLGGFISDIILLDGGWGYPSDSRVNVRIQGDGEGATAVFATDLVSSSLDVRDDVSLSSGDSITLVSAVRSAAGDVTIANTLGDVSVQSVTAGKNAAVTSERGTVTLVSVSTGDDAALSAFRGITVTDSVNSVRGDISIETTNGDLEFVQAFDFGDNFLVDDAATVLLPRAVIATKEGGIAIRSHNGSIVTPYVMNAKGDVSITSFGALELAHDITSTAGDITAVSTSGLVRLRSNIAADDGSITVEAQTQLQQEAVSGISKIELLSPGPMLDVPPDVTVTIAGPREGGDAARAIAVIERRALNDSRDTPGNDNNEDIIAYEYFIGSIAIIDPGRGYAVGEQPVVTITGVAGASARAYGPNMVAMLTAQKDISLLAGENVTLLTKIHSVAGDIRVASKTGDLDLSADLSLLSAKAGAVSLAAEHGSATVQRLAGDAGVTVDALYGLTVLHSVYSGAGAVSLSTLNGSADVRHLNANGDVTVTSFQSATLGGEIASGGGDVVASSTAGGLFLQANVVAAEAISLAAQTFVLQNHGTGLERVDVIERGRVISDAGAAVVPDVIVTIAPPISGGITATARAVIGQRSLGRNAEADDETIEFFIDEIFITNPGRGYALGEKPIVTIEGMPGAVAQGVGPTNLRYLTAGSGIDIEAGNDVTLLYEAITKNGDISIASVAGDLALNADDVLLQALGGSVTLDAKSGLIAFERGYAANDIVVVGEAGVAVERSVNAGGAITLTAVLGNVALAGEATAETGEIFVTSKSGGVLLSANIHAIQDEVRVTAHGGISQTSGSGLREIRVLSGGESDSAAVPAVTVTVADPAAGGVAATAFAELASFTNAVGATRWRIDAIRILNPGRGYAIGESPVVTINGVTGAAALAAGPSGYQDIVAGKNVTIAAGETVTLVNTVRSNVGDILISSVDRDVELDTPGLFVHAVTGAITINASSGEVSVQKAHADGGAIDIFGERGVMTLDSVVADVSINLSAGVGAVELGGELTSQAGDIVATSGSGDLRTAANVHAVSGSIKLSAHNGVHQSSASGLQAIEVLFGGESATAAVPTVSIAIDRPIGGGESARGYAVLETFRNLDGQLRYRISSIVLTSPGRGYAVGEVPTVSISGIVGAAAIAKGPTGYQNLVATQDVVIAAGNDVVLANTVRSKAGDVIVSSSGGHITSGDAIQASTGGVSLTSVFGDVAVETVSSAEDVAIRAENSVSIGRQVTSDAGDISLESDAGTVFLRGSVGAAAGAVRIKAMQGVIQNASSGISSVRIVVPGSLAEDSAPIVSVNIAAPANGGVAATASAIVSQIGVLDRGLAGRQPIWGVAEIIVTNPGSGYAVGENPLVTVTGIPGVVALATGPTVYVNITAQDDVSIQAGEAIAIVSSVRSTEGNISIATATGDLALDAEGFVAKAAGDVTIDAGTGAVTARNVFAGSDASISAAASVRLFGDVEADDGGIAVTSRSGSVFLSANIHARGGAVAVAAHGAINQSESSGLRRVELVYGGQFIGAVPPTVTVLIAAPAAGGRAATAFAKLSQVGTDEDGVPIFAVTQISLIDPGAGYTFDESPAVTVTGIPGVTALAVGPDGHQNIDAGAGITLTAGVDVTLRNTVNATTGDVVVTSHTGNLHLGDDAFLARALGGGVSLTASAGSVFVQRASATEDVTLFAAKDVEVLGSVDAGNDASVVTGADGRVSVTRIVAGDSVTITAGDDVELLDLVDAATGGVLVTSTSGGLLSNDIHAELDITLTIADQVTLLGVIDSESGDISITSRNRDLDFTAAGAQVHALQGGVNLAAVNGTIMSPPTLHAATNVTLTSFNTLALNNEITSDTGVIDLKSTSGSINLGSNLDARDDSIRIHAKGSVTQIGGGIGFVRVLNGGSGYTAAATVAIAAPSGGGIAARAMPIIGRVNGVDGVITGIRITNPGSGYGAGEQPTVTFTRNAVPPPDAIDASVMAVASPALGNSGLAAIDVLDGGSGYTATTIVTIAAPVGGGTAATAQAVIGTVEVNGVMTDGVILDIVIVNPGSGYGAGEQPVVTITGAGAGAVARAIANIALQDIRAGQDIDIYAGTGVTLLNTIRADQGGVSVTSETGNVNLTARTLLVSSFMDDIEITSRRGAIAVQRLAAEGDITLKAQTGVTLLNAVNSTGDFDEGNVSIYTVNGNIAAVAPNGLISVQNGGVSLESVNGTILVPQVFNVTGDVSLKTFGNLTINQPLTSSAGSVTLASATGAVNIAANVFADERVTLSAKTGISQTKGSFIKGNELVASNSTTSAVNLTNPANDFANVSLMSLGAVSYVDANDFETGVERSPYSGTPLGVEVRGESLNLASVGTNSRIRVVSGLDYKTLSIAAGTQGGSNVGYVEYVTTSAGDNPQTNAAFRGTLRDMIRYVNDNTATYVNAGNTRVPQAQMMVFDETGYLVEEVTPAAALPAFSRPVWFDGGRLEETATANRLGISGNNSLLHGLSFAPATPAVTGVRPATPGSSGSRVENLAVYGFTKGSGVVLASGNNTVVDLHVGLKADGTVSGNMIGLDVRGAAAINNTIGEQVVDAETVNRFAANTMAGIMIRNGAAGTQVFGSVIGDDSGANPALANGDGIQIVNATRSQIGSANAVEDDLYPSRSNIIAGNLSAGVRISNAVAGTLAAANVIRNNVIRGNRTGVDISASAFAVLGGPDAGAANVITGQTLSGVVVTDSRSVQIQGNRIGVVPAFGDQLEAVAGNGADGIAISGKSQAVEISGGNWIGGNTAHGVRIGSGVTGVMMRGNTIGGTLADGSAAGNGQDGVAITAAIGNTIGAGNVIARNGRHGVSITDARAETLPAGNRVFGSTISGNRSNGVLIGGGSLTTIGGPTVADANLITGNEADGIRLVSTSVTNAATGHVIQRNYVGANPAGDVNSELGNKGSGISLVGTRDVVVGEGNVVMNNGVDGIAVNGGRGVTIGSANAAGGNQIRRNAGHGVSFNGAVVGGRVMGNQIGFQGGDGVFVGGGAQDVRIGHIVTQSAVSGAANVVRGNAGWGVRVMPGAQRIAVQGNSSFGNMQGAMSRAAGANAAAPSSVTLTSAVMRTATGGTRQLVVTGTIAGARARQQYSVDVYASSVGESAQGRRHLGRFNVTATADGLLRFNSTITATVAVDEWISVAATTLVFDPGATSQLSAPRKAALR